MTIGTESDVRALLEVQAEAMRTKNLDRLMSLYHPDIVYFDVVPPLRFAGSAALRDRFSRWFAGYRGPIGMEIRDLDITFGGDLAVAHWFSRASGTLQDGREVGFWVRVSNCFRRTDQGWLITHEHVSLPVDLAGGRPAMDLVPD
jgi:ketosteroid isomerase-like protein